MNVCILGLGYIGLPTAVMFASNGIEVAGVDINQDVVCAVNDRTPLIEEPELKERLAAIDSKYLSAYSKPKKADVFIITVPTLVNEDKSADLSCVTEAVYSILPFLEKGNLVVIESTVPPRTVLDVICPILEKSKLILGQELYVSHAPERVIPGKAFYELENNSRVIGGINDVSTNATKVLYERIVKGKLLLTELRRLNVKVMDNTLENQIHLQTTGKNG